MGEAKPSAMCSSVGSVSVFRSVLVITFLSLFSSRFGFWFQFLKNRGFSVGFRFFEQIQLFIAIFREVFSLSLVT